jgi:hypothetical protein
MASQSICRLGSSVRSVRVEGLVEYFMELYECGGVLQLLL